MESGDDSMQQQPSKWEYHITLRGGLFCVHPIDVGGSFQSLGEAAAAIKRHSTCTRLLSKWEYHITLRGGLFCVHPIDVGGSFQSLGEAAAAIKRHSTWVSATRLLTEGYYFTLKDGCFHSHPFFGGGTFKSLDKASRALERHQDSEKRAKQFFESDPLADITQFKELLQTLKSSIRNPNPPEQVGFESEECDPDVLEEVYRIEKFMERKMAIKNGIKLMENEVLEAFEFYKTSTDYQGPNYEFVKLDQQCLIYDTFPKSYHHYNFTMKKKSSFYLSKKAKRCLKRPSKNRWEYQLFFAEVKSTEEGKQFVCYPLRPAENGHCFGCQNVGIDLRHPTSGGYEEGHEDSGFPFDSDGGSDNN